MAKKLLTDQQCRDILTARVRAAAEQLTKHGIKTEVSDRVAAEFDGEMGVDLSLSSDRTSLMIRAGGDIFDDDEDDGKQHRLENTIPSLTVDDYNGKFRQAILTLSESKRTITRTVAIDRVSPRATVPSEHEFVSKMGITLPMLTKYSLSDVKTEKSSFTAKVTARVRASSTCFLIGFDEKHMFISMLKRRVKTVEEAHAELLPKELRGRNDFVRQGEFFFIPATRKEIESICEVNIDFPLSDDDGDDTDHIVGMSAYASGLRDPLISGTVSNPRHATLFFDRWMRVVVNNEVPNKGSNRFD